MNRTELLNQIYAGRTRLEAALQGVDPSRMTEPALPGGWSVKDLLAHIGWWEQRMLEIYRESLVGQEPVRPQTADAVDQLNAQIALEFRNRDLDNVREYERQAFRDVLAMVETAPEADLFDTDRFPWLKGRGFVIWVSGNTDEHYDEHIQDLLTLAASEKEA